MGWIYISKQKINFCHYFIKCFSLLGSSGGIMNLTVIIIVLLSPQLLKKPFNIFVVHQSVIDLLVCLCLYLRIEYR